MKNIVGKDRMTMQECVDFFGFSRQKIGRLIANGNFLRMRNDRQKAVLSFIRKTPGSECWRPDEGFDYARSTRHMNKWLELAEKFKERK